MVSVNGRNSQYFDESGGLTIAAFEDFEGEVVPGKEFQKNTIACPICNSTLTWRSGSRTDRVVFRCHGDSSKTHSADIRAAILDGLGVKTAPSVNTNGSKTPRKRQTIDSEASKKAADRASNREMVFENQCRQWVLEAEEAGLTWGRTKRLLVEYLKALDLIEHYAAYEDLLIEQWKAVFNEYPPNLERSSTAEDCAEALATRLKGLILFCLTRRQWLAYGVRHEGCWTLLVEEEMFGLAQKFLETMSVRLTPSLIKQSLELARTHLQCVFFEPNSNLLPFSNGVYHLETGDFLEHSPRHWVDWQLPRPYVDVDGDWSPIERWLNTTLEHDPTMVERVLCLCAAVLRGYKPASGQSYAELIGQSGGGKGTLIRLLRRLVGAKSVKSLTLDDLQTNSFALQGLDSGIRLVIFPDEDRYRGSASRFFQLTGGDPIAVNRKNRDIVDIIFTGWVVVASTQYVFEGNASAKGAKRRRLPITGWRANPDLQGIEREFTDGCLVAFTKYLLSISLDRIDEAMKGATLKASDEAEIDPLLDWFNNRAIVDPGDGGRDVPSVPLGNNRHIEGQLFADYCRYCEASNTPSRGSLNFSRDLRLLVDRLNSEYGWRLEIRRTKTGYRLFGVRLRTDYDADPLPLSK